MMDIILSAVYVLRMAYTIFFMLFLPGFSLIITLFRKNEIGLLEKIALSPVFSVLVIFALMIFPGYFLGVDLTALNVFIMVSVFTIICLFLWAYKSSKIIKILKR